MPLRGACFVPVASNVRPHMTIGSTQSEVFAIRSPTPAEVDQLATIGAISFIIGFLVFLCILGTALAVALKMSVINQFDGLMFTFDDGSHSRRNGVRIAMHAVCCAG